MLVFKIQQAQINTKINNRIYTTCTVVTVVLKLFAIIREETFDFVVFKVDEATF
jgi:hypothetical protein